MNTRSHLQPKPTSSFTPVSSKLLQRKCACGGSAGLTGKCSECESKRLTLQRRANSQSEPDEVPPIVHEVLRSSGQALDRDTRAFMESRFGYDFSQVRMHTDEKAAQSAQAVNALAYTVGQNIVWGRGQHPFYSSAGQQLLAHELVHTIQQRGMATPPTTTPLRISQPNDRDEQAAENLETVPFTPASQTFNPRAVTPILQRQPIDPGQENKPPGNLGPPVQEIPLPPRCSIGWKNGQLFWKCEGIPGIGSTPEIPLDPREIPKKIEDILKGATPKPPEGGITTLPPPGPRLPTPNPSDPFIPGPVLPPYFWEEFLKKQCTQYPFLCGIKPAPPKPDLPPIGPPTPSIGILWTDTVLFRQDRPLPGTNDLQVSLAEGGASTLDSIVSWLKLSPTLQIRLISHASSEGTPEYNLALANRRAMMIYQFLAKQGLDSRVANPIISDEQEQGCSSPKQGVWSCGEVGANQEEVKPEDRNVKVTFFRNFPKIAPMQLTPPSLTPP